MVEAYRSEKEDRLRPSHSRPSDRPSHRLHIDGHGGLSIDPRRQPPRRTNGPDRMTDENKPATIYTLREVKRDIEPDNNKLPTDRRRDNRAWSIGQEDVWDNGGRECGQSSHHRMARRRTRHTPSPASEIQHPVSTGDGTKNQNANSSKLPPREPTALNTHGEEAVHSSNYDVKDFEFQHSNFGSDQLEASCPRNEESRLSPLGYNHPEAHALPFPDHALPSQEGYGREPSAYTAFNSTNTDANSLIKKPETTGASICVCSAAKYSEREREQLRAGKEKLRSEFSRLRIQSREIMAEKAKYDSQLRELERRGTDVMKSEKYIEQRQKALQSIEASMNQERKKMNIDASELENKLVDLKGRRDEIAQAERVYAEAENRIRCRETEVQTALEIAQDRGDQLKALETSLEQRKQELEALKVELYQAKDDFEVVQKEEYNNRVEQLHTREQSLERSESENRQQSQDLDIRHSKLEDQAVELEQLRDKLDQDQDEIREMREELAKKEADIEERRSNVENQNQKIEQWRREEYESMKDWESKLIALESDVSQKKNDLEANSEAFQQQKQSLAKDRIDITTMIQDFDEGKSAFETLKRDAEEDLKARTEMIDAKALKIEHRFVELANREREIDQASEDLEQRRRILEDDEYRAEWIRELKSSVRLEEDQVQRKFHQFELVSERFEREKATFTIRMERESERLQVKGEELLQYEKELKKIERKLIQRERKHSNGVLAPEEATEEHRDMHLPGVSFPETSHYPLSSQSCSPLSSKHRSLQINKIRSASMGPDTGHQSSMGNLFQIPPVRDAAVASHHIRASPQLIHQSCDHSNDLPQAFVQPVIDEGSEHVDHRVDEHSRRCHSDQVRSSPSSSEDRCTQDSTSTYESAHSEDEPRPGHHTDPIDMMLSKKEEQMTVSDEEAKQVYHPTHITGQRSTNNLGPSPYRFEMDESLSSCTPSSSQGNSRRQEARGKALLDSQDDYSSPSHDDNIQPTRIVLSQLPRRHRSLSLLQSSDFSDSRAFDESIRPSFNHASDHLPTRHFLSTIPSNDSVHESKLEYHSKQDIENQQPYLFNQDGIISNLSLSLPALPKTDSSFIRASPSSICHHAASTRPSHRQSNPFTLDLVEAEGGKKNRPLSEGLHVLTDELSKLSSTIKTSLDEVAGHVHP